MVAVILTILWLPWFSAHLAAAASLLRHANFSAPWLQDALLWNDDEDGRPVTDEEIDRGLSIIEKRLRLGRYQRKFSAFRRNSLAHNFTYRAGKGHKPSMAEYRFVLRSTRCDHSIGPLVIKELAHDEYGTIGHPLTEPGSIALDIGGHVGAAALQLAAQATGEDSGVFTFEPTRENYIFNQWNMWANGFHQDRVVVLHTGVMDKEIMADILYDPRDTAGASKWRRAFKRYDDGSQAGLCKPRPAYSVRLIGLADGLVDLGVIDGSRAAEGAPFPGRRIHFVKLDCEGCEYPVVTKFPEFWKKHVQHVAGEMHHHYAKCEDEVFDTLRILCGEVNETTNKNNRAAGNRLCLVPSTPISKSSFTKGVVNGEDNLIPKRCEESSRTVPSGKVRGRVPVVPVASVLKYAAFVALITAAFVFSAWNVCSVTTMR